MPKHDIEIQQFRGVHGNAGSENLPPDVFEYAQGLDPTEAPGKFVGLPENVLVAEFPSSLFGWVLTQNGDAAVCFDGTNIRVIEGLPDTPIEAEVTNSDVTGEPFNIDTPRFGGGISDGNAVYIAMGRGNPSLWVSKIDDAWTVLEANLAPPSTSIGGLVVFNSFHATDYDDDQPNLPFKANTAYRWRTSFMYDGKQESPLSEDVGAADGSPGAFYKESANLTIGAPFALNPRITAILLYRASGDTEEKAEKYIWQNTVVRNPTLGNINLPGTVRVPILSLDENSLGNFKLVKVISLTDATFPLDVVDSGETGAAYSQRTGVPEDIKTMNMSYDLIVRFENYALISGVNLLNESADDSVFPFLIMRSKPFQYGVWNWADDWYNIDTIPIAHVAFQGRIWFFDKGRAYVMAPELGDPEVLEGVGCSTRRSVVATETGMLIASENQIWFTDRTGLKAISDPIMHIIDKDGFDVGYAARDRFAVPICQYSPRRNLFLLIYTVSAAVAGTYIMIWSPDSGMWYPVSLPGFLPFDGFVSSEGDIMLAAAQFPLPIPIFPNADTNLIKLFSGTTTRAFDLRGKVYKEGTRRQVYFDTYINGDAPDEMFYVENDDGIKFPVTFVSEDGLHKGTVNSSPRNGTGTTWKRVRRFQFELSYEQDKSFDSLTLKRNVDPVI